MLRSHLISGTIALAILVLSATPLVASDSSRRTAPTTTFVDGTFGFRVKKDESRYWNFVPPKKEGPLRLTLDHTIGGKKDFIRFQVYAWETKKLGGTEAMHLERWKGEVQKLFGEIAEQKTRDKARFGRYKTRSFTAYGKLATDETQIRRLTCHVFKYKSHMYTVILMHEPGMDKKYKKEIQALQKYFRAA